MVVDLPPPPAPLTARIELSCPLPAPPPPYEYRLVDDGDAAPRLVPSHRSYRPARLRSGGRQFHSDLGKYVFANPIELVLELWGFTFRTLFPEIGDQKVSPRQVTSDSDGLGEDAPDPVPTGDPIPVGGGGGGPNGG